MSQQNELELQNVQQNNEVDGTYLSNNDDNQLQSECGFSQHSGQNGSNQFNKKYKLLDLFLLKDTNGQKSINRVCCIKIKKNWTIRKQMIISLMVLSCSVFLLVILIVIGNLFLTRIINSISNHLYLGCYVGKYHLCLNHFQHAIIIFLIFKVFVLKCFFTCKFTIEMSKEFSILFETFKSNQYLKSLKIDQNKRKLLLLYYLKCNIYLILQQNKIQNQSLLINNYKILRYLIKKSSEDAIHQQIQENLRNSAKEYSNAILEIFHGSSSKLEILTRIVLSAMKEDDQIFDFDYVKEFPIVGNISLQFKSQREYIGLDGFTPKQRERGDIDSSEAAENDYGEYEITFKYWQWGAYSKTKKIERRDQLSADSEKIIEACDVLNYFLEDFFFDKNVTYIHYIYMWQTCR